MQLWQSKTPRAGCDQVHHCEEKQYVLIRVTPAFTKSILHARGMRDDHFFRAVSDGNEFLIYNDIPDIAVKLNPRELGQGYVGEYLLITVKGRIDQQISERLWSKRIFKAEKHVSFYFWTIGLRNTIDVYKIMRHQLAFYYRLWVNTQFIKNAILITRPLYHCAVLTGKFLISLVKGLDISFTASAFSPTTWLDLTKQQGIAVLCGIPTTLYHLSNLNLRKKESVRLRVIAVSGECMPAVAAAHLREAFPEMLIYHVYGLTEASPRISYLPPEEFGL